MPAMAHRTYYTPKMEFWIERFDALAPHVRLIRGFQALFPLMSSEDNAWEIVIDSLQTAAYHFTRRRHYFHQIQCERRPGQNFFPGFEDRTATIAAFEELRPYKKALGDMGRTLRPQGADGMALAIAGKGLDTAAYHFTHIAGFYGATGDSASASRPWA